jgi:hypothetical protein
VLEPRTAVARIASAEQLTMSQLLDQYAEATGMRPEALQRAHDVLRVRRPGGGLATTARQQLQRALEAHAADL